MIRKARSDKCMPLENFRRYLISLEVSRKIARVRKRKTNCAIITSFPFFPLLNSSCWTSFPPSHPCVCILIDHWQRPIIARVASTTLYKLSKRVIRIISKSTFDSHSDPIFKELEKILLKLSVSLWTSRFWRKYLTRDHNKTNHIAVRNFRNVLNRCLLSRTLNNKTPHTKVT